MTSLFVNSEKLFRLILRQKKMLCYEDDANECETKNWLELKIEGKFWGATAAPVQFSET